MKILPAILEKTSESFWRSLENLSPYFNYFQIDIADGQFVPNKTIQIEEITLTANRQSLITNHYLSFDFHLMTVNYQKEIEKLKKLEKLIKIKNILINLSLFPNHQPPITNHQPPITKLGIVLNPEDQVEENWGMIQQFPIVQIMSVNPGFQGSQFLPESLEKINELRNLGYQGKIFLDGGINDKTLPLILKQKYLPDVLCIGSYLKTDIKERVKKIKQDLRRNHGIITFF